MKKVLLTAALCMAFSASFAQKKAVSEAQSLAKGTTPNFEEARSVIKGAPVSYTHLTLPTNSRV